MTNAIAVEIAAGVGGIFAPGDGVAAKIALDLGAVEVDERTDQAIGGHRADCRQARGAGPTEETEQNRFGLIGAGVAGGDAVELVGPQEVQIKFAAGVASGLLQVIRGLQLGYGEEGGQSEAGG